jgi:hypothetical protein
MERGGTAAADVRDIMYARTGDSIYAGASDVTGGYRT